jgi:hypothetical protein
MKLGEFLVLLLGLAMMALIGTVLIWMYGG